MPQSSQSNQAGIALILAVLILANLFIITVIVADVILRVGRSSQQIGESEIAYFAAESAIEEATYQIEKNKTAALLGTIDTPTIHELDVVSDGYAELYVEPVYSTPVTCVNTSQEVNYYEVGALADLVTALAADFNDNSCIYSDNFNEDPLTDSNYLVALIRPGGSFELDFNIVVPSSLANFYPGKLDLDWFAYGSGFPSPAGSVVILNDEGQNMLDTVADSGGTVKIPENSNFGTDPSFRIRVINNSGTHVRYTFTPRANESLPIGILVTAKGYYGSGANQKERVIVIERRNWQIY